MRCQQKELLLKAYEKAVDVYSKAVKEMRQKGKDLPVLEFEVLYDAAALANKLCQAADRKLRRHMLAHGC